MPNPAQSLPPAAAVVRHQVADFDTWKPVFDDGEDARRAAGILGYHLNRAEDDPNVVSIYMAVSDVDQAKAFAESDDLRDDMQKAGVVSAPEITWMTPVREDIVWDRELPGFILIHKVADFDAWLEGYDGADELRRAHGIVGHAVNRMLDDPSVAVVYHQAESFDDLRAFLDSDELRTVMKDAGVISEPEVSFHTAASGKRY